MNLVSAIISICDYNKWDIDSIGQIQYESGSKLTFNYWHVDGTEYFISFGDTGSVRRNTYFESGIVKH